MYRKVRVDYGRPGLIAWASMLPSTVAAVNEECGNAITLDYASIRAFLDSCRALLSVPENSIKTLIHILSMQTVHLRTWKSWGIS